MMSEFLRGDIWFFNPDPTLGREQKKLRPCLILSVDTYNNGPAELLIVLPLTTQKKSIPCHIEIKAEGLPQTQRGYQRQAPEVDRAVGAGGLHGQFGGRDAGGGVADCAAEQHADGAVRDEGAGAVDLRDCAAGHGVHDRGVGG